MNSDRVNPTRDNPLWRVGLALILANVLPGIVLFAFVATLIGESKLEGEGGLSWLGAALVYFPPFVGLILVLFGRPLSRSPLLNSDPNSSRRLLVPTTFAVFGVIGTIAGAISASDTSGGANIGAGLLLLLCPFMALAGMVWAVAVFRNIQKPTPGSATYT